MITITVSNAARYALAAILGFAPLVCIAQATQDEQVDLGGYKLFVSESGSGKPSVVFEAGLGEDVATWRDVQPQISKFALTLAYDRAGLDRSDPSPHPKTVEEMASELHSLLRASKVPPPYILVGHSLEPVINFATVAAPDLRA